MQKTLEFKGLLLCRPLAARIGGLLGRVHHVLHGRADVFFRGGGRAALGGMGGLPCMATFTIASMPVLM